MARHKNERSTQKQKKLTLSTESVQRVTADDILHRGEDRCTKDMESGLVARGTLKLSRPVAISSNSSKSDASMSPFPLVECPENVPNIMCAICLDSYQLGQVVAWSSGCTHAFHQDCISQYLTKEMIGGEMPCPSCRQEFCNPSSPTEEPLNKSRHRASR